MKKFVIESKDIVITIPQNTDWSVYQKELDAAENGDMMNFKVPNLPKQTEIGNKCYLCYKGQIIGYMKISGLSKDGFTCTTTGKKWNGNFVQRTGKFHKIEPIPYKGFQGYRYIDINNLNK